jgi:hypothetical protein
MKIISFALFEKSVGKKDKTSKALGMSHSELGVLGQQGSSVS